MKRIFNSLTFIVLFFIAGCDSVIIAGSATITIDSNSSDGQTFPLGIPIQLEASVKFKDGVTRSTQYISNDQKYITWSIAGNSGANIDEQGYLDTSAVAAGTRLVITATGVGLGAGEQDSIQISISQAEVIQGTGVISVSSQHNGNHSRRNSIDHQYFPAGMVLQLDLSAQFTDGINRTTLNTTNDASVITWSVEGETGAAISTEGLLDTRLVAPGVALVIHGAGLSSGGFSGESDVIIIDMTDPILMPGSALVSINDNASDGQYFSVGTLVQLDFSLEFSDGKIRSTKDDSNDASFVNWSIEGDSAGMITSEGLLDTSGVAVNSVLTLRANGIGFLAGESDAISLKMTCPNVHGFKLTYTCPLTQNQADVLGIDYQATYSEAYDGLEGLTYITQNLQQAKRYCADLGLRLPTKDELWLQFAIPIGNLHAEYNWPTSNNYWTSTQVGQIYYHTFDLSDASGGGMTEVRSNYTSCVY